MFLATSSLLFMSSGKNYKSLYNQMTDKTTTFEGQLPPLLTILLLQNFLMAHMNFSVILCHVTSTVFNPFKNKILLFTITYVVLTYIAIHINPEL